MSYTKLTDNHINGRVAEILGIGITWYGDIPLIDKIGKRVAPPMIPPFTTQWDLLPLVLKHATAHGMVWTIGSGENFNHVAAAIFHKSDDPRWTSPDNWSKGDDVLVVACEAFVRAFS